MIVIYYSRYLQNEYRRVWQSQVTRQPVSMLANVQKCGWLIKSWALVKTEDVAQFKQVFGTSSLIPCCMVLMLLPLDQPLTHNHSKHGATTAYILNESSSTCRVMAFNYWYNQKVMKPDKSIPLIMYRTPYTSVRPYQ